MGCYNIPLPSPLTLLSSPLQQIPSPPFPASPPILPIPLPAASPPLKLLSSDRRADRPEGHLETALGEIRALQAREQARAGAAEGASSSTYIIL
nr:hypothetical protein [Tanacetum cinerariifolium]